MDAEMDEDSLVVGCSEGHGAKDEEQQMAAKERKTKERTYGGGIDWRVGRTHGGPVYIAGSLAGWLVGWLAELAVAAGCAWLVHAATHAKTKPAGCRRQMVP